MGPGKTGVVTNILLILKPLGSFLTCKITVIYLLISGIVSSF